MRPAIASIVLVLLASFFVVGCGKSAPAKDPDFEAQQQAIEQQRKELNEAKQKLAALTPVAAPIQPASQAPQLVVDHPQTYVAPHPTSSGPYFPSADPVSDKIANDSDIETALAIAYEKLDAGGRYVVSGQITNTGSAPAPFIHVYVHLKGFSIVPDHAEGVVDSSKSGDPGAVAERAVAGEYELEVATLKNVRPGQSRAVRAVFSEPTPDAIIGLTEGQTIKNGKCAENSFHTSVSDSP